MPGPREHYEQAKSNEQFYSSLNAKGLDFFDWLITVMFYTVLHYADMLCAYSGYVTFNEHREREEILRNQLPGDKFNQYRQLKNASRAARYDVKYLGQTGGPYWKRIYEDCYSPLRTYLEGEVTKLSKIP